MTEIPPAHAAIDKTSRAPQDPASDPEHKLGSTPPQAELDREAELQRSGDAARGSVLNANTPRPGAPAKDTVRDPKVEQSTP